MCGFTGFIGKPENNIISRWEKAGELQRHRGPDHQNKHIINHKDHKLLLSFQRLKIIDLSSEANQPMFSRDNNSIILFNGEIYNFIELRLELEKKGIPFFSNSDTEVLLKSLQLWGPKKACSKFNGMWAFAYINLRSDKIFFSRDRFGKKPLYYYLDENGLYFSSEAKSLLTMIGKKFELNYQVMGEFLFQAKLNSSEDYFLKDISQIPSNCVKDFDINKRIVENKSINYWAYPKIQKNETDFDHSIEKIRDIFFDSVRLRLRSDVPVGVLLSGGLDSSSIAAACANMSRKNIILFSAVGLGLESDETPYIEKMGNYLNLDINKVDLSLDDQDIFGLLEKLIWINDQPLPSLSNLTHYLLTQKASNLGLKVLLTGQGADELICGYRKYLIFYYYYLIKKGKFFKATGLLRSFYKNKTILNQFNFLEAKPYIDFFYHNINFKGKGPGFDRFKKIKLGMKKGTQIFDRQLQDLQSLSLPQLLHTEDRMSMANSTEMRVPFLDYRLVEEILPLKTDFKLNSGWTKYIFRKAMEPYLPKDIAWRKDKQNFGNLQGEILKSSIKDSVINNYFSKESLIFEKNIFKRKNIIKSYERYSNQKKNKGLISYREVFSPISLEIWLRKYKSFIN